MPQANPSNTLTFESAELLGLWLKANHATETELWVKIFKKQSGIASVTWDDVVVEALCWGWIDGVKKSIDDQAYVQRITPRKPRSSWSKRNRAHVERLISEGRMTAPGWYRCVQRRRTAGGRMLTRQVRWRCQRILSKRWPASRRRKPLQNPHEVGPVCDCPRFNQC